MIQVVYQGGLGNNLFQYAFGRLLSERLQRELVAAPIEGFEFSPTAPKGLGIGAPITITDYGHNEGKILSLDEIVNADQNNSYRLDGFFQHHSYYDGHRNTIKSWLQSKYAKVTVKATAVHVRLQDYKQIAWDLPESYYDQCIELANPTELYVFTDEPTHPYIKKLLGRGAKLVYGAPSSDLQLMSGFDKLIISRSTYSWWAAYLSSAAAIYYPRPQKGFWSKEMPHKNISVPSAEYIHVDC